MKNFKKYLAALLLLPSFISSMEPFCPAPLFVLSPRQSSNSDLDLAYALSYEDNDTTSLAREIEQAGFTPTFTPGMPFSPTILENFSATPRTRAAAQQVFPATPQPQLLPLAMQTVAIRKARTEGLIPCPVSNCNTRFQPAEDRPYHKHLITHAAIKPFLCTECTEERGYSTQQALFTHFKKFHKELPLPSVPTFKFPAPSHEVKKYFPYLCNLCNQSYRSELGLMAHAKKKSLDPDHMNPVELHIWNLSKNQPSPPTAQRGSESPEVISSDADSCQLANPCQPGKHVISVEEDDHEANVAKTKKARTGGLLPCLLASCANTFDKIAEYENHLLAHANKKRYACDICDYQTDAPKPFETHYGQHHPGMVVPQMSVYKFPEPSATVKKYFPVSCSVCNQSFTDQNCLHKHERSKGTQPGHKNPIILNIFNPIIKSAVSKESAEQHKKATPAFLLPCPIIDCLESVDTIAKYYRHLIIHANTRDFKCNFCEYQTCHRKDITTHATIAHSDKPKFKIAPRIFIYPHPSSEVIKHFPFLCQLCNQSFGSKSGLNNHLSKISHDHLIPLNLNLKTTHEEPLMAEQQNTDTALLLQADTSAYTAAEQPQTLDLQQTPTFASTSIDSDAQLDDNFFKFAALLENAQPADDAYIAANEPFAPYNIPDED